jgi:prepilin-type N-terminal cleavage/methylation domain-containing protein
MRLRSREHGFSVMELLIVVFILLVLMAAALPSVNRTIQLWRLETSTAMVVAKIADARMNSIKRNRPSWLLINAGAGTIQVQSTNPATNAVMNIGAAEQVRRGVNLVAPTPANVTFDSLGWPTGGVAQTIRLQNAANAGNDQKNVNISVTGRVTVTN